MVRDGAPNVIDVAPAVGERPQDDVVATLERWPVCDGPFDDSRIERASELEGHRQGREEEGQAHGDRGG